MGNRPQVTILRPLKKAKTSKPFITFDIEAKKLEPDDRLNIDFLGAGVYDGKEYFFCSTIEKLVNILLHSDYAGYSIYAHNASRYDFLFLIPELMRRHIFGEMIRAGSRCWIFLEDRALMDSLAIIPVALEKAAKSLDIPIHKVPLDFDHIEKGPWKEHLEADCKMLYGVIESFTTWVEHLGGWVTASLAGTALSIWRSQYQHEPLYSSSKAIELCERAALYGGRNEIFRKRQDGKIWNYDINSSYSTSALEPLPTKVLGEGLDYIVDNAIYHIHGENTGNFPVLPMRADKLYFPVGEIDGWYCGNEINYALDAGTFKLSRIIESYEYEMKPIFIDYVLAMYDEKRGGNVVAKWLQNAIFGRMGLNRIREKIYFGKFRKIADVDRIINDYWNVYGVNEKISSFAFPAIFAFITANARIRLHEAFNDDTLYCDTDSIISSEERADLPVSDNLGDWKLEGVFNGFRAIAPKTYRIGETYKAKGFTVKDNGAEIFEQGELPQHSPDGIMTQLKTGRKISLRKISKKLILHGQEKRYYDNSGYSRPWNTKELTNGT